MTGQAMEILLVEDDPRDARMTVRELQKSSIPPHIDVVQDGEEALDYLFCRGAYSARSLEHPPQLILLDLKLPKVDGLQVLREIKGNPETRPIPVVMLTSSKEEKDMVACYQLGVNSYIQKPVEFEKFQEAIRTLGLYWTKLNEPPPDKTFQTL
jgi:two-component system, response regulator